MPAPKAKILSLIILILILILIPTWYFLRPTSSPTKSSLPDPDPPVQPFKNPTETLLTGTVKDQAGNPIEHALVSQGDSPFDGDKSFRHTYTDADGVFFLNRVRVGDSLMLAATAPGFSPKIFQSGQISPDPPPINLTLAPGHTVKFHFIDQRGNPILGVRAEPYRWQGTDVLRTELVLRETRKAAAKIFTSDDAGNITWPSAPVEKIQFGFEKADLYRRVDGEYAATDSPITITLKDALKISASVTDAKTHQPIPAFNFFVGNGDSPDKPRDWDAQAHPATDGAFTYIDPEPDKYAFFRIEAPGYPPMIQSISMDKNPATLTFELSTENSLKVTVLQPDKRPATNVKVHTATADAEFTFDDDAVRDGDSPGDPPFQLTDQNGQCILSDPGKTSARIIILDAEGFADLPAGTLHKNPTITLEPWGSLKLHIHDAQSPLAHAAININYELPATPQTPALSIEIQQKTSATGDATFYHLPPRPLTINYDFRANESSRFSEGVIITLKTLTPSGDQSLDLPLDSSGQSVIGKITGADGSPLPVPSTFSLGEIETTPPPSLHTPEEQAELQKMPRGSDARKKWYDNFIKLHIDRIRAYQKMSEDWYKKFPPASSNFIANPDGSFRASNILPGSRTLTISLLDPATGKTLATLHHTFTIPEKISPTPIDLGTLQLEKN